MDDSINPMRRYKWIRPRQMLILFSGAVVPTNNETKEIWNNSTGAEILVVRDITIDGTSGDSVRFSYSQTNIGGTTGVITPMVPGQAPFAGTISRLDTATTYAAQWQTVLGTSGAYQWPRDSPIFFLTPGWGLIVQDATAAHSMTLSAMVEVIREEELDYWY